jgi:phosphate transport system substrate-binding protein
MNPNRFRTLLIALAAFTASALPGAGSALAQAVQVDKNLSGYKKVAGISGTLNSIGSDTLNNLMTYWAEDFRKHYPNVNIQIEGKGSATAPPALISVTAQLGPMSRTMNDKEIEAFEKQYGYKPTRIGVALDSLAVYVNKDNPVKSLSMPQVDAIFSQTRKGGHKEDLRTWDQVGLTGSWAGKPISLYGRNSASGTYGYFKEHALYKGDYKDSVKEQPGSASVVQGITNDLYGIGYSGIGYMTSGVRAVPLAAKQGASAFEADYENVLNGKYPLSRMLYIYVAKKPSEPLPPLIAEFLRFVLSKEGQEIVIKDGYLPLPAKVSEQMLAQTK